MVWAPPLYAWVVIFVDYPRIGFCWHASPWQCIECVWRLYKLRIKCTFLPFMVIFYTPVIETPKLFTSFVLMFFSFTLLCYLVFSLMFFSCYFLFLSFFLYYFIVLNLFFVIFCLFCFSYSLIFSFFFYFYFLSFVL